MFKILITIGLLMSMSINFYYKVFSQDENGMIIYQIDGNHYRKDNFTKAGKLKNYQTIEVGQISSIQKKIEAKLTVVNYKANGDLKDATQTTITCNPEARQVLVGIFPFVTEKSQKSITVEMEKGSIFYPVGWQHSTDLKDFSLNLKITGGAAGFFGTRSHISITNRKVKKISDKVYQIDSKMTLKAFLGGINLSTLVYSYQENIHTNKGIIKQIFTEESGAYFTLNLTNN